MKQQLFMAWHGIMKQVGSESAVLDTQNIFLVGTHHHLLQHFKSKLYNRTHDQLLYSYIS